jgi:hypothetical protein
MHKLAQHKARLVGQQMTDIALPAQAMMQRWWVPPRGAWLPFGPARFSVPGHLPTPPLRALQRGVDQFGAAVRAEQRTNNEIGS